MLTTWVQQLGEALGVATDAVRTPASEHAQGQDGHPPSHPLTPPQHQEQPALTVDTALVKEILALARDAAHTVERPAAPLTTFLVGYAAGQRGGSAADWAECAGIARELLRTWPPASE